MLERIDPRPQTGVATWRNVDSGELFTHAITVEQWIAHSTAKATPENPTAVIDALGARLPPGRWQWVECAFGSLRVNQYFEDGDRYIGRDADGWNFIARKADGAAETDGRLNAETPTHRIVDGEAVRKGPA